MKFLNATKLAALAVVITGISMPVRAASPLVDVEWVKANIGKEGVVFVDFRPKPAFLRGHIPGAVNTQYGRDGWRESRGNVPGMLPKDPSKLAALIGRLGIDNSSHVVLVPPGNSSSDMGIATRVYWTFKVFGHDNVSILDGGFRAYVAEKKNKVPVNPLEQGPAKTTAKTFTINLRPEMIVTMDDVKAAAAAGMTLVDARPADQYLGVNRHGRAKASGTIPGALNLPQSWTTENGGGKFRSVETLKKLYAAAGIDPSKPQINFCNTGHWASVDWFVASELLGNKDAKMYDGSMTEWTNKGGEVEAKIKLQ